MKLNQKIAIIVVMILAFAGFQAIGSLYHIHLTVPFISSNSQCNHFIPDGGDGTGCSCHAPSSRSSGFPFRDNLYDICHQDTDVVPVISFTNYIIQAVILVIIYDQLVPSRPVSRRVRRARAKARKRR